jgi:predicted RNA binding protein YcfA (HicA-like mRNA interferase family)
MDDPRGSLTLRMARLPRVSGDEAIRAFERLGYEPVRQSGSHVRMKYEGRQPLTVPRHKELKRGLLRTLIRDAGFTVDEFSRVFCRCSKETSDSASHSNFGESDMGEVRRIPLPRTRVNKLLDDVRTSLSDYHHRAWCVPDDRVRDTAHQSPPYPPAPPAAHHDQTDP